MRDSMGLKTGKIGAWTLGAAAAGALVATHAHPAQACGGFFCSASNPVNQAAEQIVFADNPDGTVTAIIQIMYEGPAERFAWVLPIAGVPEVEVSSEQALDRLKQSTNPQYILQTTFEGECFGGGIARGAGTAAMAPVPAAEGDAAGPAVMVEASGTTGPYDWVTISLDPALSDPADVAVDWLGENGYDVSSLGPDVLRPYLEDGLNLLAFRLTKGSSTGSIRPVMLTYESDLAMIPIRPTAVAANDDMPVLVWVLGQSRAIPKNYKALELNEALIDWFNPNNNYNDVVSAAADEAQGQGFVTEFAGSTSAFAQTVLMDWERQQWEEFSSMEFTDAGEMIRQAMQSFGGWDGFNDALSRAATLPEGVSFDDFQLCFRCYADEPGFAFDMGIFLQEMYEIVVKPMLDTQALIDSRPYITRFYTTMSAEEMTLDPVFDQNADLPDVDNLHTAERIIECGDGVDDPNLAPWRVELPQGGVVRGTEANVWPVAIEDEPAALRIIQFAVEGQGEIIEDRSSRVADMLDEQNREMMAGTVGGADGAGGSGDVRAPGREPGTEMDNPSVAGAGGGDVSSGGGGCSVARHGAASDLGLLVLALAALGLRRRRAAHA